MQGDRSVFKVVYVVLESQYQSSLTAACKRINAGQPDVAVEVSETTLLYCAEMHVLMLFTWCRKTP